MIKLTQDIAATFGVAVGSGVVGVATSISETPQLGVVVTIALFILGMIWKQAKWQQKVDDNLTQLLDHQTWQLENHAKLSRNQHILERKIEGLPCGTVACPDELVELIGDPDPTKL